MFERSIPVLMYHHVSPVGTELTITPELFEDQLRSLQVGGWKTLSGDEFLSSMQAKTLPRKSLLLTFDDGFADNYVYAYPLLKKYGMRAMLFVTASLIRDGIVSRGNFVPLPHRQAWQLAATERGAEVMCTWAELKEMEESSTFEMQAHGMTHETPALIKEKRYDELRENLYAGRKEMAQRLSKEVAHLAWPKGVYDNGAIDIALRMGFRAVYTTTRGANTPRSLSEIRRIPVKNCGGTWLLRKLWIYSSPLRGSIYLWLRTGW
jgi:peptidoglycan/xylan/chitin deacetylase (PgdA/CDA1 family)